MSTPTAAELREAPSYDNMVLLRTEAARVLTPNGLKVLAQMERFVLNTLSVLEQGEEIEWPQQRRDDYADGYEFARQEILEQGEEMDWCEVHGAPKRGEIEGLPICVVVVGSDVVPLDSCRMVPSLRIPSTVLDPAKNKEIE